MSSSVSTTPLPPLPPPRPPPPLLPHQHQHQHHHTPTQTAFPSGVFSQESAVRVQRSKCFHTRIAPPNQPRVSRYRHPCAGHVQVNAVFQPGSPKSTGSNHRVNCRCVRMKKGTLKELSESPRGVQLCFDDNPFQSWSLAYYSSSFTPLVLLLLPCFRSSVSRIQIPIRLHIFLLFVDRESTG